MPVRRLAHETTVLGGGRVDILVTNAGVFPFGLTEQAQECDVDAVNALNVKAPFYLVAEPAPAMAERSSPASSSPACSAASCSEVDRWPGLHPGVRMCLGQLRQCRIEQTGRQLQRFPIRSAPPPGPVCRAIARSA